MAAQIVTLIVEVGAGVGLATGLAAYAQRNWTTRRQDETGPAPAPVR